MLFRYGVHRSVASFCEFIEFAVPYAFMSRKL
nr:MAG TPA: hypothetical protein [Caudoviricetes sp.]